MPQLSKSLQKGRFIQPQPDLWKRTISAQLHIFGALGALVAVIYLIRQVAVHAPAHMHAAVIFAITSILVFTASAVYHFICDGFQVPPGLRRWLKDIDHFAIYFFIAGSYTIFVLNVLDPVWSHRLTVGVWTCAGVGVLYTHLKPRLPRWARSRVFSTAVFVAMSWLVFVKFGEIVSRLPLQVFWLLLLGGISYLIGTIVYVTKRPRFFEGVFGFHEIWHVTVIFGYTFHYFVILSFYT